MTVTDQGTSGQPAALVGMSESDTTWRGLPAAQQPSWPNASALHAVIADLNDRPPLVAPGECELLRSRLAAVALGKSFLLQAGSCAETFDENSIGRITSEVALMHHMSLVMSCAGTLPVLKLGRLAGQYAKPRSCPNEVRGGVTLPAYRGDAVNGTDFTEGARTPDPARLTSVYEASAAALGFVRSTSRQATDGQAALRHLGRFVAARPGRAAYRRYVERLKNALSSAQRGESHSAGGEAEFFVSHEALLLDYEHALTRKDPETGELYDLSGHMLWVGERTRQLDGAHIEFASRVRNPIGVKLGPSASPAEVATLVERLDPERAPGRLTLISRMGAGRIREKLPVLIERVAATGAQVVWACDPMHGNTRLAPSGHKTRSLEDITDEVDGFFAVHRELGSCPGGVHIELTGGDVTECTGGSAPVSPGDVPHRYETVCDPRLNRDQSLDLAFLIAQLQAD